MASDILSSIQSTDKKSYFSHTVFSLLCFSFFVGATSVLYHSNADAAVPVERRNIEVVRDSDSYDSGYYSAPSSDVQTNPNSPSSSHYSTSPASANSSASSQGVLSRSSGSGNQLWDMFNEIETIKRENLELRGLIEQQSYQIEKMKTQVKQNYLDLDSRIENNSGSKSGRSSVSPQMNKSRVSGLETADQPKSKLKSASSPAEKDLYQAALNHVRNKNYVAAKDGLASMLQQYPKGFYAPYAHYWLAEVFLAIPKPDLQAAQKHFSWVVSNSPNHTKVPPSLYKLGTLSDALGDTQKAKEALVRILKEHPNSGEAKLAKRTLEQLESR